MSFQAMVGTWLAAQLVTDMPVGARFGLSVDLRPIELQFETGDALDDAVLRLADGGAIYFQCKTRPALERGPDSALAKTIGQLVRFAAEQRSKNPAADPTRVAAVLAIADNAPRSMDALDEGCRNFDRGGAWADVVAQVSDAQRDALAVFRDHVTRTWKSDFGSDPGDEDLVDLARLFRIRRFGVDAASADWREATSLVGSRLYAGADLGGPPTSALLEIVRQLIRSGAAANRNGLARALRIAGYPDARAPGFDQDIDGLRRYTTEECERLARHTRLEADRQVPLLRECLPALKAAIGDGSLLVIGEPGAGKTGVLVALAREFLTQTAPFVLLSVDRLAGITKLSDLKGELGLKHDLLDVLEAWPGDEPGVIIIDALDASRGGPSEAVFASLIELALPRLGERWSIVASIRTFDLLNGRRFREAMQGAPPNPAYAEQRFGQARHFLIKALSPDELREIGSQAPQLGDLIETAPPKLKLLLTNIFNLSLAADLIKGGVTSQAIRTVNTQSELIDRYEDERLPTQPLKRAASAAIAAMVGSRRLTVPRISVHHDALDGVLQAGVLVPAGDLVAFAHHVLFDHVAGRYYLAWSDPGELQRQVSDDPGVGLLLGPALRFAMERIWQSDDASRSQSWKLLNSITSSQIVDPVVASVALRTIAERVEGEADVAGLLAIITNATDRPPAGAMLSRLARFVGMTFTDKAVQPAIGKAWSRVAEAAASLGDRHFADAARFLLWSLYERADFGDATFVSAFGLASRALLGLAWSLDPYLSTITIAGIRCVAKSYGSDPQASRRLLQQILEDPHFTEHAHSEAPWLAEGVPYIIPHDADFVATIYSTLFGRPAPQDGKSWLGGQPSQILPLSTNRKQEYEHAYWHLNRALRAFLEAAPKAGVAAVIGAAKGMAQDKSRDETALTVLEVDVDGRTVRVIDEMLSLQDWRRGGRRTGSAEEDVLSTLVDFLVKTDAETFRSAVETATASEAGAAIWARLLRIGSERPGVADDLLWPLAATPALASIRGLARDAVIYLGATYTLRPPDERQKFEAAALQPQLLDDSPAGRWWRSLLSRLLSLVPEGALATAEMKQFRAGLATENLLRGNPAFVSVETHSGPADDITDFLLTRDGVDLESEPDRSVRAATRVLEESLKTQTGADVHVDVIGLWRLTSELVDIIDRAVNPAPHAELLHSTWGAVSNAVERISTSDAYDQAVAGHPDPDALLALISRLGRSPYPEERKDSDDGGMMGWGNWDVRVYAASSAMRLAQRFAADRPEILDELDTFVRDAVPTVRLQVAQSINSLWDVARERMWSLADYVAKNETSTGVLGFFISGPLQRIAGADPERTERLLSDILIRTSASDKGGKRSGRNDFEEAAGNLVAWLCVKADSAQAWSRFATWVDDLVVGDAFLWAMLSSLREVLFFGYRTAGTAEEATMRARAQTVLDQIVTASVAAKARAEPVLRSAEATGADKTSMEALYVAADRLIDHACNQLYFGSGAFRQSGDGSPGIAGAAGKQAFLQDYRGVLDEIGRHGSARTIHHLVDLYVFVVEASPADVFDHIAAILTGPGVTENYQFEALGADALVALVRVYLADYRSIFENSDRRARLVTVLEIFSAVGWPDALKLLYELPDLLR
jgi:hypothetical protein